MQSNTIWHSWIWYEWIFTKLIFVAGLFSHSVFQVFVLFFTTVCVMWWTFGCHLSPADTIVEHEGGIEQVSSETWNALLQDSPSLPLCWHCSSRESTDWESHMAGNKPRAGFMSTLCRGSGTLPPHLKGSSDLALYSRKYVDQSSV